MREIKFRGKRIDNGEWVYGYYRIFFNSANGTENHFIANDYSETEQVVPETVGQFTGLIDKNGKEIYEGDIVKIFASHNSWSEDVFKIEFMLGGFSIIPPQGFAPCTIGKYFNDAVDNNVFESWADCNGSVFEVIGNIHDNPELLK